MLRKLSVQYIGVILCVYFFISSCMYRNTYVAYRKKKKIHIYCTYPFALKQMFLLFFHKIFFLVQDKGQISPLTAEFCQQCH